MNPAPSPVPGGSATTWLASADPATAWAHRTWNELAGLDHDARARLLVVLPVHGFADHGLGLPLDAEEIAGSAILQRAIHTGGPAPDFLVLPPLRFGLAPYPSTFFGTDPATMHKHLLAIAGGVRDAGAGRLVFLNTSPWNMEMVATAAIDARVSTGLQTYVIHLPGLGLDFHPDAATRSHAQAAAAWVLGLSAAAGTRPVDSTDADFRPGCHRQPAPQVLDPALDGRGIIEAASTRLAGLLGEIAAHRQPPDQPRARPPRSLTPLTPSAPWPACRSRYLPALTRDALEALPGKADALVIIPTGAIEQHGPHLPLGVDAILGQAWLHHALAKLPPDAAVYVTPPVTFGKSNEHTGFAGTLSLDAPTLRALLLALAGGLKALGFRQLAVLNTHGGNSAVLVYTIREIQTVLGLRAGLLGGFHRPEQAAQESAYGFHAGEWETALMLACAPELVRMDRAVCEYPAQLDDPGELRPENAPAVFSWMTRDVSQSGIMGNPTTATAAQGRRWLDEGSSRLAARITALLHSGRRPEAGRRAT